MRAAARAGAPTGTAAAAAAAAGGGGGGAGAREWVCVSWGLTQLGVAFSTTFTARLLRGLARNRSE